MPIVHNSDQYEFIRGLGGGNFGVVRLLKDKQANELVASKYIERGDRVRLVLLVEIQVYYALFSPFLEMVFIILNLL